MKNHAFHVAIIGGGMGGLCLANGLKKGRNQRSRL